MSRWIALCALGLFGCRAEFVDQRPGGAGADLAGAAAADLAGATVVARGTFAGVGAHAGSGTAQLLRRGDGAFELHLGADFAVTDVAGPVLVLSGRDALGNTLQAGDLLLGALRATTGAQAYPVPGGDGGRRSAWIFSTTFGTEVAQARLGAAL